MIAYLVNNNNKKEIVFSQFVCDFNDINRKIDASVHGVELDKVWLKHYVYQAMQPNYDVLLSFDMYCNPKDILRRKYNEVDFERLDEIFKYHDYETFEKKLDLVSSRLLMFYIDVMPNIKLKELNRFSYDEAAIIQIFNLRDEDTINSTNEFIYNLNTNTKILELINKRNKNLRYNYENVQNTLNNDKTLDDDCTYKTVESNVTKAKKIKLARKDEK